MSTSLLLLDSAFRPLVRQFLADIKESNLPECPVTSTYRSSEEQKRLYQAYRQGRSVLPAAPPGTSLHEYGLAIDLLCPTPEAQAMLAEAAPEYGLKCESPR